VIEGSGAFDSVLSKLTLKLIPILLAFLDGNCNELRGKFCRSL
jgi:hypothetical protein